ncbi:MAG: hypothetical protein ACAI38_01735 [Myxococcota bacterium]
MPNPNGEGDAAAVAAELADLIERQRRTIAAERLAWAGPDAVRDDLAEVEQRLAALGGSVRQTIEAWRLTPALVYELNRSAGVATAALRHTPPLAGLPEAVHPLQQAVQPAPYIMDYARSGARLSYVAQAPFITGVDHPLLAEAAERARRTIHGAGAGRSLLFGSGMGAMNTAIDFMAQTARAAGRRNLLGRHSWIEVQAYALEQHPDTFTLVDETDADALASALADPAVFGVIIEPLPNHPTMPVAALDVCYSALENTERMLLLDAAHTPEVAPRVIPGVITLSVVSGVKFLQAGLDLGKSGLLTFWGDDRGAFARILELRERSGRVPSFTEARLACLDDHASFQARLARYDRNMRAWAAHLDAGLRGSDLTVVSPWLEDHPHHARSATIGGGRFVYLGHRSGTSLLGVDRWLCTEAAARDLPGVAACTFGLNVPHANIIVGADGTTFLRLSSGSDSSASSDRVVALWSELLAERFRPATKRSARR